MTPSTTSSPMIGMVISSAPMIASTAPATNPINSTMPSILQVPNLATKAWLAPSADTHLVP